MLSHCLRDMRSELETKTFRAGDTVVFTAAEMQTYISALGTYERMVRQMEKQLAEPKPSSAAALCEIVTFPAPVSRVAQLSTANGDDGSVA